MSAQRSIVIGGGAFAGLALALALRQGLGADLPIIVADPALKRHAVAAEPNTTVLAIGGKPGEAFTPSAWEHYFAADAVAKGGDLDEAYDLLMTGLAEHPGNPSILYNLACAESLGGRPLDALLHLQDAVRAKPEYAERARTDPDFDPIRREQGFPA